LGLDKPLKPIYFKCMINNQYNLSNLEADFLLFLKSANIAEITLKNYLSDINHFFGWLEFYLKSKNLQFTIYNSQFVTKWFTQEIIREYKNFLAANNIPRKTVNRRLSTLRKFGSFCVSQQWLKENPAKQIANVTEHGTANMEHEGVLREFETSLKNEGQTPVTIKNYLSDIRQFLNWAGQTT